MAAKRVALVTGANKGIGFQIVRRLCSQDEKLNIHTILCARDAKNGEAAVERLRAEGFTNFSFQQLDVNDEKSATVAAEAVKRDFGGLDILINNAGMAWKGDAFNEEVATTTIETNYYGVIRVTDAFIPILRKGGRIVNISSMTSQSALKRMSKELRDQFLAEDLTRAQLTELMENFKTAVKEERTVERGWPKTAYGISKVGVAMLTRVYASENKIEGVLINSCCPGWCKTDMAGDRAPLTAEEGSITPVYLALLPPDSSYNGLFFRDAKVASFVAE